MIGHNHFSLISNSYSRGNVSGTGNVGGLIGYESILGNTLNSFYCINDTKINGRNLITPYGIFEDQYEDWITDRSININDHMVKIMGMDCYTIGNVIDLKAMLPFTFQNYEFKLMADIDLSWANDTNIPIFMGGTFEGDHKAIMNMEIVQELNSNTGFFGFVGEGAVIANITLINGSVTGKENVGGLVGTNYGTISNTSTTALVCGDQKTGGLVGYNWGNINNASSTGFVNGASYIGGIVGYNYGTIRNSFRANNVNGTAKIGGLVGGNSGVIIDSYNEGKVSGTDNIGGLVGANYDEIIDSYNIGPVNGTTEVGGLVGYEYRIGKTSNSFCVYLDFCHTTRTSRSAQYSCHVNPFC